MNRSVVRLLGGLLAFVALSLLILWRFEELVAFVRQPRVWPGPPLARFASVLAGLLILRCAVAMARTVHRPNRSKLQAKDLLWIATITIFAAIALTSGPSWPLWLVLASTLAVLGWQLRSTTTASLAGVCADLSLPFIVLYLLLQTLSQGAWPLWASLALTAVGGAFAVLQAIRSVRGPQFALESSLYGAALACVALNSPLGVLAALWISMTLALLKASKSPLLPLSIAFVGWWFSLAAAAASQSWLLVVAFAAAGLIHGLLGFTTAVQSTAQLSMGILWSLAASVLVEPAVRQVGNPILRQLALGLNQLGRIEPQPWIGITALNAASQRVLVLPSILWLALALVIAAVLMLIVGYQPSSKPIADPAPLDPSVRQRVWWLPKS